MKSGFVAIIGKPNAGKSTLLNALIKQKISIVSWRPQTTRNRITGILTNKDKDFQLVFLDTPGLHTPKNELGIFMQNVVKKSLLGIDAVVYVADAGRELDDKDIEYIAALAGQHRVVVIVNKTDEVTPDKVMSEISKLKNIEKLESVIPTSATKGSNLDVLVDELLKLIGDGVQYYPDDMITDRTTRFLVGEIIREKALKSLSQEVPHGIGVEVTKFSERKASEIVDINADIICEKQSHKAIIIGRDGAMLKRILTAARIEMEHLLETKVFLTAHVKVKEDWRDNVSALNQLGYDKSEL